MQRLMNRDVVFAAILVLFSIGAWGQATALSARAAVFPRLVVALLLLFSAIYLVRALWQALPAQAVPPFFTNLLRLLIALVLVAAYVLVFPQIGFFSATLFFIPVFAVAIGMREIATVLIGSVIFTFGAWVVFVVLLNRRLPPEIWLTAVTGGGS